jgi:hypothetical protein
MLLVAANTSPIRYLVSAPPAVQTWIKSPAAWLRVLDAVGGDDPALLNLDVGTRRHRSRDRA